MTGKSAPKKKQPQPTYHCFFCETRMIKQIINGEWQWVCPNPDCELGGNDDAL